MQTSTILLEYYILSLIAFFSNYRARFNVMCEKKDCVLMKMYLRILLQTRFYCEENENYYTARTLLVSRDLHPSAYVAENTTTHPKGVFCVEKSDIVNHYHAVVHLFYCTSICEYCRQTSVHVVRRNWGSNLNSNHSVNFTFHIIFGMILQCEKYRMLYASLQPDEQLRPQNK